MISFTSHRRSRPGRGRQVLAAAAVATLAAPLTLTVAQPAAEAAPSTPRHAAWDFEGDAVGATPSRCTAPPDMAGATVTDRAAHGGRHSLQLQAAAGQQASGITCPTANQQGGTVSLWARTSQVAGFTVDLLGTTTTTGPDTVARVSIGPDGALTWLEATRVLPLAPAGTITTDTWSRIEIGMTADQDMVELSVDGTYVGTGGPIRVDPITSVTGVALTGTTPKAAGEPALVDDLRYGPAAPNRPRHVRRDYRIGPKRTMVTSTEPAQMPSSAVRIPGPRGERILATYPAHTDTGTTSGNEWMISDDEGQTWQDYQSHNPMPDASSTPVSRLRDGTLLATNFHVYATERPDQPMMETAVSTDNGETWTTREGTLTTPTNLKPYACERASGCNAVFLVHNVIEGDDGTLYQSAYGLYDGESSYRQLLLTSTDQGLTWGVRSTVAYDPDLLPDNGYSGPCEGTMTRVGEHGLIMVMRTGSYLPLFIARSFDDGHTWSAPEQIGAADPADPRVEQPVMSVYPTLERIGDGSLLMLAGRPGLSLLRSFDEGQTWTTQTWVDYTNSANGHLLPMGGNKVMVFGDQGADWQHPKEYGVWNRTVDVLRRR